MDRTALKEIVEQLKSQGKTVVFTNGCFDLLHIGHVRYLEKARALGDFLVVGVNTDSSVKRLKGDERPINPEDDRAEVMAALESVDYVTLFPEDTPVELISYLQPSIHVKGGDYEVEDLPESAIVHAYGGKVVIIPLVEGRSTTKTIERMKDTSDS